jgi:putative sugar O-methyltransferase
VKTIGSRYRTAVNRLTDRARLSWLLWRKGREFRNCEDFEPDSVLRGFQDQPYRYEDDREILDRIIAAYKKAKASQLNASDAYQVSNEWLPIYDRQLRDVMQILQREDRETLRVIYRNFMRDRCSTGLHGLPVDMQKEYFQGKISRKNQRRFLIDSYHRYSHWKSLLGDTHSLRDLIAPSIGNPYGYYREGVFIRAGADYHHYYATAIARLIRKRARRTVVELGGGFGGMAYYLVRDNDNLTYIDFDLPENVALASYYLLCAFPEKHILLYGEADLSQQAIAEYDLILLPSFEIGRLQDRSVDLFFNSYSLAEMSQDTIRAYIEEFDRSTRGYILHVNHTKRSEVVADDFGIDPAQFDLLYKIAALWNAGRDATMDEFEYLYKRIDYA